jgi:hypothetical protein
MAIVQKSITNSEWTALTTAGQSGTCWLDEDNDGASGHVDVRIIHSSSSVSAIEPTTGKRLYRPAGNNDLMTISADSSTDVFYARCFNSGDTALVSVDAV